jgi:hypothetical protein
MIAKVVEQATALDERDRATDVVHHANIQSTAQQPAVNAVQILRAGRLVEYFHQARCAAGYQEQQRLTGWRVLEELQQALAGSQAAPVR